MGLLLSPDHTATLTDPHTWSDNPFVTRDTRRDIKKRQPFVAFCWMSGILLVVAPWMASLLWSMQNIPMFNRPLFIGEDTGTALCVIISGVHIWFVIGASGKHAARQFTEESNQNTLSSLLMLPISPFQILAQGMAYPWIVGMRLAVALLPIYVFCVAIDGPTWIELLMLYLVFSMAAFSVPFWNRPALSENVSILANPKQSRIGGASQAPVGRQATAARSASSSGALVLRIMLVPIAISWIIAWTTGGTVAITDWLHIYLPTSITSLVNSAVLSWPLLCARLLITPLDWFGFSLIPLPFVLALFLAGRYVNLVKGSEFLSVGAYRDLPMQSTYLPRLRVAGIVRACTVLVVIGYLWKLLVVNGALDGLAPPVLGPSPGLAGFAFAILLFATVWALSRGTLLGTWQRQPLIRGERFILCRCSLLDGARYLAEPFVYAAALIFVCCLISRTWPFPPLANGFSANIGEYMLRFVLIGLSGGFFSFAAARLLGQNGAVLRIVLPVLILIGLTYSQSPLIRSSLASYPQIARVLTFVPQLTKLEIVSPLLGVMHVNSTRSGWLNQALPNSPPWYHWVAVSLFAGSLLWVFAVVLESRRAKPQTDAVTLVFNPTILGREVFSDPIQQKKEGTGRADTPFAVWAIACIQRCWDNAVITRELRSRLRGQWERQTIWGLGATAAALSIVFFYPPISMMPSILGGWVLLAQIGPMRDPVSATAAGVLGCWYIALCIASFATAFVTSGAFYAESQKSTLGFLLATPLSSRAIVLGKALGLLGPSLMVIGALSCWSLLLTLLFLPMVGQGALFVWFYIVVSALSFYFMVNSITFSISALFPRLSMSGSAWIWVLFFWFGTGPLAWIFVLVSASLAGIGLKGSSLWLAFIGMAWLIVLAAYTISVSSIHGMRRRDLTFATTKRSN